MAFTGGNNSVVWCNGYDLSAYFKKAGTPGSVDLADVTTFSKTSKVKIPVLKDASVALEGLFDGVADAVDQVLAAALAATALSNWTVGIAAGTQGTRCRHFEAAAAKYDVQAPVDGVVSVTAEAQSSDGPTAGIILKAKATDAAGTTNTTGVDNGAASTGGGSAVLHVFAVGGGFSTATIKVQDSADGVAWADLITFTAVTAAPTSERKAVTGTVRQHLRVNNVATGGTITCAVSFARG